MSSHIHLAMTAGDAPPFRFLKALLVSVARQLNLTQHMFGPVFGDRATTVVMPRARMARLGASLHNNPLRAGLLRDPSATDWTSHRFWSGHERSPAWAADEARRRA